jgi:hypothetical protein
MSHHATNGNMPRCVRILVVAFPGIRVLLQRKTFLDITAVRPCKGGLVESAAEAVLAVSLVGPDAQRRVLKGAVLDTPVSYLDRPPRWSALAIASPKNNLKFPIIHHSKTRLRRGWSGPTSEPISPKPKHRVEDRRPLQRASLIIRELVPVRLRSPVSAECLEEDFMRAHQITMPREEMAYVMDVIALRDMQVVQFIPKVFCVLDVSNYRGMVHQASFSLEILLSWSVRPLACGCKTPLPVFSTLVNAFLAPLIPVMT